MTRTRFGVIALAIATLGAPLVHTQNVRDAAPRPASAGAAVVGGRVVTEDAQPRPVRRATVMLAAGQLAAPRSTVTDDEGRFIFARVPAGSYSLVVNKAGYVAAYYGSRTPGQPPGVPIAVLEGQQLTDLSVRLLHGSVLAGVVRRESGQPAAGVGVQAAAIQTINGQRRMSMLNGGSATTDDRGEYRIFGLAPGEYMLMARTNTFAMPGGEARQISAAELRWADQIARGRGLPAAAPPPSPDPGPTVVYTTVYYPGTVDPLSAGLIALGPDQERNGVNFTTPLVPTAKVTGVVLDPSGTPMPNAQLSARIKRTGQTMTDITEVIESMVRSMAARTGADGTFSLAGIPPGEYTLMARAAEAPAGGARQQRAAAAAGVELPFSLGGGANQSSLWANEEVVVQGRDVTNLTLRLQPGMTVSGRVVYDSATQAAPAETARTRIMLASMPTGSGLAAMLGSMMGPATPTMASDGTFTARGVVPGPYRVTTFGAGTIFNQLIPGAAPEGGWALKSAMLGGRDIADVPFDVRPGEDVSGIVVTFTDRPTELSGSVLDSANRATGSFPIVVFSTDRAYWTLMSRRVQLVRPSSDGKFKTRGLPAGEYFVCAVTEANEEQLYDPLFLELLVPGAFKITLADGEKKVQDLRLAGGG